MNHLSIPILFVVVAAFSVSVFCLFGFLEDSELIPSYYEKLLRSSIAIKLRVVHNFTRKVEHDLRTSIFDDSNLSLSNSVTLSSLTGHIPIDPDVDEVNEYMKCQPSMQDEPYIVSTCTHRMCTSLGLEILVDRLVSVQSGADCTYGKRLLRTPNIFFPQEQAASSLRLGSAVMYPDRNFTDVSGCQEWFFANSGPGGLGLDFFHQYLHHRIPTSGISTAVMYSSLTKLESALQEERRYLVVFAAASSDEYRLKVNEFTLRRLRADLGEKTFVIYVDALPFSKVRDDVLAHVADVILFADFISSDAFYDSVAMQEGMLEAFRLFGMSLLGFYGLVLMNDSLIGPISGKLADVLPELPEHEPVVVASAVWTKTIICGGGIMLNRVAFVNPVFANFWLYIRIPCGKWGSMLLWEGILHKILINEAGMRCYTFTNDIMALNLGPADWGSRGLRFYKHKNSGDLSAVLRFISEHNPMQAPFNASSMLEICSF